VQGTDVVLPEEDQALLQRLFDMLSARVGADPYGWDGAYAMQIRQLPVGLRAMAATHYLDVSLTLDDIGWHFLNFGEPNHVKETEAGLRELGLEDLAEWFHEAYQIVLPVLPEILGSGAYLECMEREGRMARINELTRKATELGEGCGKEVSGSAIYAAWVKYARTHPERVFAV
jgi:hypothetical protein